jgi:hypothetical protein
MIAQIECHDDFFRSIINIIPQDLYQNKDDELNQTSSKYFKHRQLPLTANERKQNSKKRKSLAYGAVELKVALNCIFCSFSTFSS